MGVRQCPYQGKGTEISCLGHEGIRALESQHRMGKRRQILKHRENILQNTRRPSCDAKKTMGNYCRWRGLFSL